MNNELENRIKKLEKEKIITYLLTNLFWILSFKISADAISTVLPMTEIILILLDVNNINQGLILSFMEFFYRFLPTIVYIGGQVMINSISKEISGLKRENKVYKDNIERKEEVESIEAKIIDEKEIIKVYDIVERFEKLPRDKQMEVLNYIKGDLSIEDNQLCNRINELNDNYKNMLQIECEDILFPDFENGEVGYTKKREK